jgi:thiol:disulfide interchange protein DsbD
MSGTGESQWILNNYPVALNQARASGKLVFIDFSGYTCTNCRWMESNIFARPEIRGALNQFVLSRLFTDGEGELYEKQQLFQEKQFSTVALPLYAVVDANGKTVATFAGVTRNPAEFLAFLNRGARGSRL